MAIASLSHANSRDETKTKQRRYNQRKQNKAQKIKLQNELKSQ